MRAELYDLNSYAQRGREMEQPDESKARQRYWAELDLSNLAHNFQITQSLVPDSQLICVLKNDAYGHGAVPIARGLLQAGASYFAVATAEEAMQLRRGGIEHTPILTLGPVGVKWIPTLSEHNITVALSGLSLAYEYFRVIREGQRLKVHICVDTGMNRDGFRPEEVVDQVREIAAFEEMELDGIFTHFVAAEDDDEWEFTCRQVSLLDDVVSGLAAAGIHIPLKHSANSAGVMVLTNQPKRLPQDNSNAVRPGFMLYGANAYPQRELDLRPVLTLRAVITKIKTVPEGETVSYNRTWTAPRDSLIATIGVGYGDGYLRSFSNKAEVLIDGRRVPQIGRICMDQCMIDITGLSGVQVGDCVTLLGADGDDRITYEELSRKAGIIPVEIMSAVGKRLSRIYIRDGKEVTETCYIDCL